MLSIIMFAMIGLKLNMDFWYWFCLCIYGGIVVVNGFYKVITLNIGED